MASKVSTPPKKPTVRASKPVKAPTRPTPRPTKPVKASSGPVDRVSVRGNAGDGNTSRVSALEKGLMENFSASDAKPTTEVKKPGQDTAADPGQQSVDLARKFEGMLSQDVKGQLEHFGAAGGKTNNCADFVSSVLKATDRGVERTASVSSLRKQLLDKGWTAIPQDQARPGDVWMTKSNTHGSRHTELVSTEGGTHTIGSNNISSSQQKITEREKEGGVFYGYRPPPVPTPRPAR